MGTIYAIFKALGQLLGLVNNVTVNKNTTIEVQNSQAKKVENEKDKIVSDIKSGNLDTINNDLQ